MSRQTMLALDPGGTTGYVLADYDGVRVRIHVGERQFTLGEMYRMLEFHCRLEHSHVIYEDFSYRNASRMGTDLTPVKLIGIIELFQERHEPFTTFTKQSAATGKNFYNDDKLKELGVYVKGMKHGRDATRHLLQWINFGAGGRYIDMRTTKLELSR